MSKPVDVCLLLEGTYPYVSGGVATWTHEMIQKQDHLNFHIVAITPRDADPKPVYELPRNVVGLTNVPLMRLPAGEGKIADYGDKVAPQMRYILEALTGESASLKDLAEFIKLVSPYKGKLGSDILLDGKETWNVLVEMYEDEFRESSFLDYFWSWRAVLGSLYSLLLCPLPQARVYHALSTGYAGVLAARAKIETGKPVVLTEHGIYTNERRIEVALADWLEETASKALTIDKTRRDLRDLWIDTFTNYSRIAYQAADRIITLFEGNQDAQRVDGADPAKQSVIPNGVDVERFRAIPKVDRDERRPTVALIGRVVPIKDVKNFIRACAVLREYVPDLEALIMGPYDEDPAYYEECREMVEHFGIKDNITFTGKVRVDDYLGRIDLIALTSISEAQPLAILEAGAMGIPSVVTHVGACQEMVLGNSAEEPPLGAGGVVTPLSNPTAVAEGMLKLLTDRAFYESCSKAISARVDLYYNKNDQYERYKALYGAYL